MSPHLLKLRVRRFWRRRVVQPLTLLHGAGELLEKYVLGRLNRLRAVRRFVLSWLALMLLLVGCLIWQLASLRGLYQTLEPVPGGHFSEGIVGSFTTASPLYAVTDVDASVSRLIFASLLTYDDSNRLTGDLADNWNVDDTGKLYTVHLRPGLTWQDGAPLTASDVAFTYHTIQNPDAGSPLFTSWQGVTVTAVDPATITFKLPNALAAFPYSLTNGIVPEHILGKLNPVDLRTAGFNTNDPVGAGPFRWSSIGVSGAADTTEAQITLLPFAQYWAGMPKLASFSIYAYADSKVLIQDYTDQAITAVMGLDHIPSQIVQDPSSHIYSLPMTAGVLVFFQTSRPILSDVAVRQALALATDRAAIIQALGYTTPVLNEPLLRGQLGYDPVYAQVTGQLKQAQDKLTSDGWVAGPSGVRTKNGQKLSFTLTALNTPENRSVTKLLQKQWAAAGVDLRLSLQNLTDFQGSGNLQSHTYDALLDGISIGVDPDVFTYWDSSQSDPRSTDLNFSVYKSTAADLALEAGRTRLDPALRVLKYKSFLQAWQQDTPAIALYQPRLLYISHDVIYGLPQTAINTDDDRFRAVQNWTIDTDWVTR